MFRTTNLKTLFSMPTHSISDSKITKASISKYVGEDCTHSHLVFVDGEYSPALSDTSKIPSTVTATSLIPLLSGSGKDQAKRAMDAFLSIPDTNEVNRDSFASDTLTGLTLVKLLTFLKCCISHLIHLYVYLTTDTMLYSHL